MCVRGREGARARGARELQTDCWTPEPFARLPLSALTPNTPLTHVPHLLVCLCVFGPWLCLCLYLYPSRSEYWEAQGGKSNAAADADANKPHRANKERTMMVDGYQVREEKRRGM